MKGKLLGLGLVSALSIALSPEMSVALPPPEEIPEEVLRSEIITEARSPIDNRPLSAAGYAELEARIEQSPYPPVLSNKVRELIRLLYLRKFFKTFMPI